MENLIKKGLYEKHKELMRKRYIEKIKFNTEEIIKRNEYYRKYYLINKEKIQLKRRIKNFGYDNKKEKKEKKIKEKKIFLSFKKCNYIINFD